MTLAALAGLAGCAKENVDTPEKNSDGNTLVTLTASQENAESKAEISSADRKVINWTKDDAITVIDGAGKNVGFTLTEGEGTNKGKFKGEVSQTSDSYTALYPYEEAVSYSDGSLSGVVLKSEQEAVPGSFDPKAALMMAVTESGSTNLGFKNIVGFVKVTPTVACARIALVSNNPKEALAGTADITMTDNEPKATVTANASSCVSIVGDIEANKTYYIAIFPAAMASGFRLVFTTADGQDTYKNTDKQLEIKRNLVTNLGNVEGTADEYPYVTFTAAAEQTFKMKMVSVVVDKLEYSIGGANWQSLASNTDITFGGSNGSLRLRGKSDVGTAYYTNTLNSSRISFGNTEVNVSCTGDIRTLIDWENYDKANTENARFSHLFKNCVVLTSAPKLPMKKLLTQYCCEGMFEGCSNLSIAPELPATELAEECYQSMFSGCSALTKAPNLPAENVPSSAYNYMFNICSSLEEMPLISAITVEEYGMAGMFEGCSNLSKVQDLCVETFTGKNNCASMFMNCTSLTTSPKLPATNLTDQCYFAMFANCSNLSSAPALNAAEVPNKCYQQMFFGCTSLKNAPALPATTVGPYCYQQMFWGCTGMESGPESLPATKLSEFCYQNMFRKCTSLTKAPKLMAEDMAQDCCAYMFKECSKLDEVTLCVKDFDTGLNSFTDWLAGTASTGTVHIRSGLSDATKEAIYRPNDNWTFVEDVTD